MLLCILSLSPVHRSVLHITIYLFGQDIVCFQRHFAWVYMRPYPLILFLRQHIFSFCDTLDASCAAHRFLCVQ
jgi:hypothetical protein